MVEKVRRYKKLAILAGLEATYATNTTALTGVANAIQASEATFTPLAGGEVSRDLLLPYLGHQGVMLTNEHVTLQFSVEMAGSGDATKAPAYGVLLRMCGMAEVKDAGNAGVGVKVQYSPISDGFESGCLFFIRDKVKHVLLGARGTFSFSWAPAAIPRFTFNFTGLIGTVSDEAMPTVDLTKFQKPLTVNKANTAIRLHGWDAVAESFSFDLANQVEGRFLIGDESIQISDRMSTGSAVVEARDLATINWIDIARKRTRGALKASHGKTAGNIIELDAPAVEIGRPTEGQTNNIANNTLPLMFVPVLGNDELVITAR